MNESERNQPTNTIPEDMSQVIRCWIDRVQSAIPSEISNSDRWQTLLSSAENTGREREGEVERSKLIGNTKRIKDSY